MTWVDGYVGIPFADGGRDRAGVDCWGLFRLVYAEQLGIDLPSYGEISAWDLRRVARAIERGQESWIEPAEPAGFDAVLMRHPRHASIGHVGVLIDRTRLLHIEERTAAVIVPLAHFTVRFRIAGYRRHREAAECPR